MILIVSLYYVGGLDAILVGLGFGRLQRSHTAVTRLILTGWPYFGGLRTRCAQTGAALVPK